MILSTHPTPIFISRSHQNMHPLWLLLLLIPAQTNGLAPSPYITHTFTFPHIPYHLALRHIHTPEHCIEPYALLPPHFNIVQTSPPQRLSVYNTVGFRFTTVLGRGRHYGTMFSCSPECSQLLLMDPTGTPYMLVSYSVRAYVPRMTWAFEGGHTLMVTGTYLRVPGELELMLTRRLVTREAVQKRIQMHRSACEDRNLKLYRHWILKF
jgi:hypothetical protein